MVKMGKNLSFLKLKCINVSLNRNSISDNSKKEIRLNGINEQFSSLLQEKIRWLKVKNHKLT